MKSIILLLLFPIALNAQIKTKTDEFTGQVTIVGTIQPAQNSGAHTSRMLAMRVEGDTFIVIYAISDSWVHLSDNTVHALSGTNKTRVNVSMLKVDQETDIVGSSVYTTETIAIKLSTHLLNNPMLIRIGTVVYTVPPSVVADVRSIGQTL